MNALIPANVLPYEKQAKAKTLNVIPTFTLLFEWDHFTHPFLAFSVI